MLNQTCHTCGNKMIGRYDVPLEFCTNCGGRLLTEKNDFGQERPTMPLSAIHTKPRGSDTKFIGIIIGTVALLIIGALGFGFFLSYRLLSSLPEKPLTTNPQPQFSPKQHRTVEVSNVVLKFGSKGQGQGQFENARSIAIDNEGNIFVGDETMRIQKFDSNGKFLQLWNVTEGTIKPDDKSMSSITNLAIDSKNRLYVAVGGKDLLRYEASSGKFIDKVALYGEKWMNRQMEARILDLVVLNDDNLMILATSFPNGEYVIKLTPDGKYEIKHKDLLKKKEDRQINLMNGKLLVGFNGELFLFNSSNMDDKNFIYRFKSDGTFIDRFSWENEKRVSFFYKTIALNSKGHVLAFDANSSSIKVLSADGVLQRTIQAGTNQIINIFVDKNDNIFLLRSEEILKLSLTAS